MLQCMPIRVPYQLGMPAPATPQVRFQAAAERARCLLESPDAAPLLAEHSIYVHLPDKARKLMGANAAALRRVAAVLGAKVRVVGSPGMRQGNMAQWVQAG